MNKQRQQYNRFNKGNNSYPQKANSHDNHNSQPHQSPVQFEGLHQRNPFSTPPTTLTQPIRSGPCVACETTTVLICQRCSDFFCSIKCQMKNWPQHRYICFKMPSLVHSSTVSTEDMPPLAGYLNKELPPVSNKNSVLSSLPSNQHHKWTPSQQQDGKNWPKQENDNRPPPRPVARDMSEQQNKKSSTPPRSDKLSEKSQPATSACNIGKIQQVEFPENNTNVLVTAFRSSNRIFLRSMEKEENEGYCDVIKSINMFGKTAGPLKTMPLRNAFAITDFNNDGLFYRVQVVAVKDENDIKVIYYDFGNEDTKKLSQLKEISKECAALKQYVVPATLLNVPFVRDCQKLDEYLKTFEDTEGRIVIHKEKERTYCDIFPRNSEKSLNQQINAFIKKPKDPQSNNVASQNKQSPHQNQQNSQQRMPEQEQKQRLKSPAPVRASAPAPEPAPEPAPVPASSAAQTSSVKNRPSQLSKAIMVPPFEMIPFPAEGKNLNVMIVDNSLMTFGYIGCLLVEDKSNLQAIQQYLADYEDNGQPYKPKFEEYCLGKYEDCWYRARVVAIASEKYVEVVFIDFLNECTLEVTNIRRYPMDLDYPCKSSLCLLEELPSVFSEDIATYLKDKLRPGSEHKIIEVKGMVDDESNVVLVKMDNVSQWLSDQNK